jgi:hypothetical protein
LVRRKLIPCQDQRWVIFLNPINAVKIVPAADAKTIYQRVHTFFQSTSSCNILTVNALSSCSMMIQRQGQGDNKQYWDIEMNDAPTLCRGSYYQIDCVDHLIQTAWIFNQGWKYCHLPVLHGKGLALVVAFNMFLECCEGKRNLEWSIEKLLLGSWHFPEKLSPEQMLAYTPAHQVHSADQNMRNTTQQSTRSCSASTQQPSTHGCGQPACSTSPEVATTVGRVRKE